MPVDYEVEFNSWTGGEAIRETLLASGILNPDARWEVGDPIRISESDPAWPTVRELILEYLETTSVGASFPPETLAGSTWLEPTAEWECGYPQPTAKHAYIGEAFDLSEYCKECGVGLRQVAPFRLDQSPGAGDCDVFRAFWLPARLFISHRAWEDVFEPRAVACREVIVESGRKTEPNWLQIDFEQAGVVDVDIPEAWPRYVCAACGRTKFCPKTIGWFHAVSRVYTDGPVVRTRQWFGSGCSAFQCLLFKQSLHQAIQAAGLRGFRYAAAVPDTP